MFKLRDLLLFFNDEQYVEIFTDSSGIQAGRVRTILLDFMDDVTLMERVAYCEIADGKLHVWTIEYYQGFKIDDLPFPEVYENEESGV